jgi:hypothetical protein
LPRLTNAVYFADHLHIGHADKDDVWVGEGDSLADPLFRAIVDADGGTDVADIRRHAKPAIAVAIFFAGGSEAAGRSNQVHLKRLVWEALLVGKFDILFGIVGVLAIRQYRATVWLSEEGVPSGHRLAVP